MTVGLDSTGFTPKALSDIQTEVSVAVRGAVSPDLNLSSDTGLGQTIGSNSSQTRQVWEAAQAVYASFSIDGATGAALNDRCRLTGTSRRAATYSTADVTITLAAGTYLAGTLTVHTADATAVFANANDITVGSTTTAAYPFKATRTGPVRAEAGTLVVIATPVTGFSVTAPYNAAAALVGLPVETDAQLRARQRLERARTGSTTVNAIRTDVSDTGVISAVVIENDTDSVDVNGIAAHGVGLYVIAGAVSDATIASALYFGKAAGIATSGTTTVSVLDSAGNAHDVNFSHATVVPTYRKIAVTALDTSGVTDQSVRDALVLYSATAFGIGKDVIRSKELALVADLDGVVDVTSYALDATGPASSVTATTNIVMTATQYGSIPDSTATYTDVTVTYVGSAP